MPKQTVKVKKALRPMPGAWAKGTLASSAVSAVPMAAEIQVASITALKSMPVWDRKFGLTKMMYAMAKKVVKPPATSLPTVVPCSFSLNIFSMKQTPPFFWCALPRVPISKGGAAPIWPLCANKKAAGDPAALSFFSGKNKIQRKGPSLAQAPFRSSQ